MSLANRCLRPPLHWFHLYAGVPDYLRTQVDERRMTSKRAVILPQPMREVQAIREMDQEKLFG